LKRSLGFLQINQEFAISTINYNKTLKMELERAVENLGAMFNEDGINAEVSN